MSILLRVAYHGAGFHGFARQADGPKGPVRTVQGELEAGLTRLYRQPVLTRGASRTDAGVHALGQLVAYEPPFHIEPVSVARALSGRLPRDLTVVAAWEQFGPDGDRIDVRAHNQGKHYRYEIRCTWARDPLAATRQWHLGRRVDPAVMQRAAESFAGTHDYGSFRGARCQSLTTERTIDSVTVEWGAGPCGPMQDRGRLDERSYDGGDPGQGPDLVRIHVRGGAFLYNMVRIMVGTLVEIGRHRRPPELVADLLANPDRRRAGPTAPAAGLTLVEVRWPELEA